MRNPKMSHHKADTTFNPLVIGANDLRLMKSLVSAGHSSHRKFLRMITISLDIKACTKFFDEFDTYEFVVSNSSSQMHTLGERHLTHDDFHYIDAGMLSMINEKMNRWWNNKGNIKAWRYMVDSIPQSYLYTRTVTMNYEVFLSMYPVRKSHRMHEWVDLCRQLRQQLPYMDKILKWRGM
jgi:hypothetical protein